MNNSSVLLLNVMATCSEFNIFFEYVKDMAQTKSWKARFPHVLDEYTPFDDGNRRYAHKNSGVFIHLLDPSEIVLEYFQKFGFRIPALIHKGYVQITKDISEYSPSSFGQVLGKSFFL